MKSNEVCVVILSMYNACINLFNSWFIVEDGLLLFFYLCIFFLFIGPGFWKQFSPFYPNYVILDMLKEAVLSVNMRIYSSFNCFFSAYQPSSLMEALLASLA